MAQVLKPSITLMVSWEISNHKKNLPKTVPWNFPSALLTGSLIFLVFLLSVAFILAALLFYSILSVKIILNITNSIFKNIKMDLIWHTKVISYSLVFN